MIERAQNFKVTNGENMPRFLSTLPLVTLLILGTAASAQETTTGTTETESTTQTETQAEGSTATGAASENAPQEEESAADTGLDMGKEVQEDPTYIKATYGDWDLKCFRSEGEEDLCQMYQLLREDAGNPVAEFSIYRLPEGQQAVAGATLVVPLGTLLSKELQLSIDGGKPKTYPYSFCTMIGCFSRLGLSASDIEALKRGVEANLQIVPAQAPDQVVNIKASLKGFTAAFENASTIRR